MDGAQQTLLFSTAGRVLPFSVRRQWDQLNNRLRSWTVWLVCLLTVILAYDTLLQLLSSGEAQRLIAVPFVVAGGVLTALFAVGERKARLRALQTGWYNEQADKPRLLSGVLIELYGDRAVRTDLRTTATVYYRDLTAVIETANGFLLLAGSREVVINSADMTPEQTAMVAEILRREAGAVYQYKQAAVGRMAQPLPLPLFESTDAIVSRGTITLSRGVPAEQTRRQRVRLLTAWILPMTAVFGCTLACWVSLTQTFVLDLLLLMGTSMAVGVLLTAFGWLFGNRRMTVQIAITREGIGGFAGGVSEFLVWGRVRVRLTERGLHLTFPDDIPLCIPWRSMDDPTAVQQFFNTQSR